VLVLEDTGGHCEMKHGTRQIYWSFVQRLGCVWSYRIRCTPDQVYTPRGGASLFSSWCTHLGFFGHVLEDGAANPAAAVHPPWRLVALCARRALKHRMHTQD